ncbi:hypothetical protein SKAU_G00002180 [Synaphobranchus kaupii]|uniref:RRM domain-containing protein n=1 Tax=Synaphobranchus kaupii TaxID=118154 RepID=A0A9Q1JC55_SYNKA|nr:hypothetical protein SKAU_G00002180 [Synaphobranchus kaupii]
MGTEEKWQADAGPTAGEKSKEAGAQEGKGDGSKGDGGKGDGGKGDGSKGDRHTCCGCRFPLLVALLQLLLGIAVASLAFIMNSISPSLLARETPHWAGIIVCLVSLLGFVLYCITYLPDEKTSMQFVAKLLYFLLSTLALVLSVLALAFAGYHYAQVDGFTCSKEGSDCRTLKLYFLLQVVLNLAQALVCLVAAFIMWKHRYQVFFVGLQRTRPAATLLEEYGFKGERINKQSRSQGLGGVKGQKRTIDSDLKETARPPLPSRPNPRPSLRSPCFLTLHTREQRHGMDTEGSQSSLSSADSPHDPCKMFIGGLSWQTTQEGLKEYFSKFGEVKECMVMRDPVTKRSRGFGFVTYVDQAGVDKVLAQPRHELDSKTIDPKVAFPRRAQPKLVTRTKKIFVGGLSVNTTIEDVKQYFDQFGKVGIPFREDPSPDITPTPLRSQVGPLHWGLQAACAIPLTAYGPMAAGAAAAAAVVRGSTPSRSAGFLGTSSPGPMADLYGAANQDTGVSSYISAASPAPSTGFGHSLGPSLMATTEKAVRSEDGRGQLYFEPIRSIFLLNVAV